MVQVSQMDRKRKQGYKFHVHHHTCDPGTLELREIVVLAVSHETRDQAGALVAGNLNRSNIIHGEMIKEK